MRFNGIVGLLPKPLTHVCVVSVDNVRVSDDFLQCLHCYLIDPVGSWSSLYRSVRTNLP